MNSEQYPQMLQRYTNFCQYFGLAPLTKLSESSTFYTSPSKFTLSIICNLFQITHAIYQVYQVDDIQMRTMSAIIHFIWMFQCLLTNLLVSCQSMLVSKYLVAYLNQLCDIDNEIRLQLQIVPNYQRQSERHFRLLVFVLILSLLATWILYGSLAFFYRDLIAMSTFVFIPAIFMSIRVFQIVHSIELLNDYLDIINWRLKSISTELNESQGDRTVVNAISTDLITLRKLYGRCWHGMQLYNQYFGFSNLLLLLFYSYDLLHGIYNLFLYMYGLRSDLAPLYGSCCLPSAINLFIITYAAVRCRNKAKETGIWLGKFWKIESCHMHLKRFSLQVIHQQFPMIACGFFIVDFQFLGGIIVGFSNLLLLFIQFEIKEKTGE